jgi:hypothetical protein
MRKGVQGPKTGKLLKNPQKLVGTATVPGIHSEEDVRDQQYKFQFVLTPQACGSLQKLMDG